MMSHRPVASQSVLRRWSCLLLAVALLALNGLGGTQVAQEYVRGTVDFLADLRLGAPPV